MAEVVVSTPTSLGVERDSREFLVNQEFLQPASNTSPVSYSCLDTNYGTPGIHTDGARTYVEGGNSRRAT
jgi:hypothetical protein